MTVRLAAAQKAPRATRRTVLAKIGAWTTQSRSWPLALAEAAASADGKEDGELPFPPAAAAPPPPPPPAEENAISAATHARRSIRNCPVAVTFRKSRNLESVRDPTQLATTGQWWSKSSVQRSQARQCLERRGRRVVQVAQEPAWWFGGAAGAAAGAAGAAGASGGATRPGSARASESWSARKEPKQRTRVAHSSLSRRRSRGRLPPLSVAPSSFQIRGSCQTTKEKKDAHSSEAADAAMSLEPGRRACGGANLPSFTTKRKTPNT